MYVLDTNVISELRRRDQPGTANHVPIRIRPARNAWKFSANLLNSGYSCPMIRANTAVRGALSSLRDGGWTARFVLFLRIMAWVSLLKGLYHWAEICGIIGQEGGFEAHIPSWQATTIFFAVINPVAAIGLWLLAPWGAVIWLTSAVAVIVVHVFFDQVYGSDVLVSAAATLAIIAYLTLAVLASREQPN